MDKYLESEIAHQMQQQQKAQADGVIRGGNYPGDLPQIMGYDPFKRQVGGDHYKNFKIQPGDFIAKNDLKWYEGNVVKYICRNRFKGKRMEDLQKCKHYVELAIAKAEEEENDNVK